NNLLTGGGSALSLDGLTAARAKLRTQKGIAGESINLAPKFLVVPSALETLAYQLTSNAYIPTSQAGVNEFAAGGRTALTVVVDPLLDAASTTAWYLLAESALIDTVEYAYLDGADGPVTETREGFEVDGTEIKCRLDFAAKALDYRGMVKSNGA
ncbi:MAG: peptidase, partial [Comamonadaceae bacterium]